MLFAVTGCSKDKKEKKAGKTETSPTTNTESGTENSFDNETIPDGGNDNEIIPDDGNDIEIIPDSGNKPVILPQIAHETVYSGNAAILPYANGVFSTEYDDEANKKRQEITNYKDSKVPYENVYYISYRGDDSNNGRTPSTPWKTNVNLSRVPQKSAVLFERDGIYRFQIQAKSNTFYGAYGEGAKPFLYGSPKNYANQSLWTEYEPNIWKASTGLSADIDIGGITFDHGKKAAVRMGKVSDLDTDYMYCYDKGVVYLYLTKGNPATIHKNIEFTVLGAGFKLGNCDNIIIENIGIKYNNFGISTSGYNDNIVIRGMEIGYIGGCDTGRNLRWGNGVEIWGNSKNITIEDCWVYQCYDAGITNQCSTDTANPNNTSYFENIKFNKNLIEFCQYPIEFFNSKNPGSYCKNMYYTNNILRFAGYQVYDPKKRWGSDSSFTACVVLPWYELVYENFIISGNIMDTSYGYMVKGVNFNSKGGATAYENKYLQQSQKPTYFWINIKDPYPMVPSSIRNYPATSQATFEEGVKKLDSNPKSIKFME